MNELYLLSIVTLSGLRLQCFITDSTCVSDGCGLGPRPGEAQHLYTNTASFRRNLSSNVATSFWDLFHLTNVPDILCVFVLLKTLPCPTTCVIAHTCVSECTLSTELKNVVLTFANFISCWLKGWTHPASTDHHTHCQCVCVCVLYIYSISLMLSSSIFSAGHQDACSYFVDGVIFRHYF